MKKPSAILFFSLTLLSVQNLNAQCLHHPAVSGSDTAVTYSLSGGSFQSFGCPPIDPTYWVSGFGATMTVTFTSPQAFPAFRVWGMNDDDSAAVSVNGAPYILNASTAFYDPKVVCGLSPGPDGVIFANGILVGANTNSMGNYSYQDVYILSSNVTSITVTAHSGAGWGYAGSGTDCPPLAVNENDKQYGVLFPTLTEGKLNIRNYNLKNTEVIVMDIAGGIVKKCRPHSVVIDLSDFPPGIYLVTIRNSTKSVTKRVVKI